MLTWLLLHAIACVQVLLLLLGERLLLHGLHVLHVLQLLQLQGLLLRPGRPVLLWHAQARVHVPVLLLGQLILAVRLLLQPVEPHAWQALAAEALHLHLHLPWHVAHHARLDASRQPWQGAVAVCARPGWTLQTCMQA